MHHILPHLTIPQLLANIEVNPNDIKLQMAQSHIFYKLIIRSYRIEFPFHLPGLLFLIIRGQLNEKRNEF